MPAGKRTMMNLRKTLTAVAAVMATAGWVTGVMVDPTPIRTALALMGVGGAGVLFFSLRPLLRPRHSHSSLPLFPVLVVA
jgi:hypothetical protein